MAASHAQMVEMVLFSSRNYGINKANVDLVFHRNNLVLSKDTDAENQISTVDESSNLDTARGNHDDSESDIHDEVAIAKMTAYLNQQH